MLGVTDDALFISGVIFVFILDDSSMISYEGYRAFLSYFVKSGMQSGGYSTIKDAQCQL